MRSTPGVELVVARYNRCDVETTEFSGQLCTGLRRDDLTSIDQLIGRIEQLEPVEKERALLWIEESESLIEQNLPDVGLDLREIGIDGSVEREILADPPPHITAKLSLPLIVATIADRRRAICMSRHGRCRLEHQSAP